MIDFNKSYNKAANRALWASLDCKKMYMLAWLNGWFRDPCI